MSPFLIENSLGWRFCVHSIGVPSLTNNKNNCWQGQSQAIINICTYTNELHSIKRVKIMCKSPTAELIFCSHTNINTPLLIHTCLLMQHSSEQTLAPLCSAAIVTRPSAHLLVRSPSNLHWLACLSSPHWAFKILAILMKLQKCCGLYVALNKPWFFITFSYFFRHHYERKFAITDLWVCSFFSSSSTLWYFFNSLVFFFHILCIVKS